MKNLYFKTVFMSLHGNFERVENGFEFPKDEFGKGKFHLKSEDGKVLIKDRGDMIASADLRGSGDEELNSARFALIEDLDSVEDGCEFLEVVGGSDYLKDFLEKIVNERPRSN